MKLYYVAFYNFEKFFCFQYLQTLNFSQFDLLDVFSGTYSCYLFGIKSLI